MKPTKRKADPELERLILDVVGRNADVLVPKKKDKIKKPLWVDTPAVTQTQNWSTTNAGVFIPLWVPTKCLVQAITITIGTSSGNLDLGVYDHAGHRLGSLGSTASPGTGSRTFNFTPPIPIPHEDTYYFAMAANNTTLTYSQFDATNTMAGLQNITVTSTFPLPASVVLGASSSTRPPWMGIKLTSSDG